MIKWIPLIAIILSIVACASSPQLVTMSTGRTKSVGNGRAALWLGIVDVALSEDSGGLVNSAEIELTCQDQTYFRIAIEGSFTEPACDLQVRLVEVIDNNPPAVRLEVIWQQQFPFWREAPPQSPPKGGR